MRFRGLIETLNLNLFQTPSSYAVYIVNYNSFSNQDSYVDENGGLSWLNRLLVGLNIFENILPSGLRLLVVCGERV